MFLVLSLAFAADVEIIPSSTGGPSNCIPFGKPYKNSSQYQGFVYQNIPAFELYPGDTIAFDLGAENDTDITVDIALATATSNGSSEQDSDGFTTVVSSGTPADPNGNTVHGDYELEYTVDTPFSFAGGGLIMRFQGKGAFASDTTCTQVLVITTHLDASGYFVGRFYKDTDGVYTWDGTDPWELGGFQITYAAWYADSDGDGYGDPSVSGSHGASGYVSDNTDCDDTDDTIYPGASELCDGQANDCNGAIGSDEVDSDGDSYVVCTLDSGGWDGSGTVIGGDDCDDGEATVQPTRPTTTGTAGSSASKTAAAGTEARSPASRTAMTPTRTAGPARTSTATDTTTTATATSTRTTRSMRAPGTRIWTGTCTAHRASRW